MLLQKAKSQSIFKKPFEAKQILVFDITYKYQIPGADLAKRYGANSSIGGDILLKSKKNWLLGASGYFLWGKNVKESGILDSLKGSTGELIDQNGQFSVTGLEQRGLNFGLVFGKIFSFNQNKNSGLQLQAGTGYISHHIKIFSSETVPQLSSEMKKGYDRYTSGTYISQYIGYRLFDPRKRLNFSVGIEFIEGFTQSRRSFDYDTRIADTKKRMDLLSGFKFSLTVPIFLKKASDEEFFE